VYESSSVFEIMAFLMSLAAGRKLQHEELEAAVDSFVAGTFPNPKSERTDISKEEYESIKAFFKRCVRADPAKRPRAFEFFRVRSSHKPVGIHPQRVSRYLIPEMNLAVSVHS
jgi:hypothetical protein